MSFATMFTKKLKKINCSLLIQVNVRKDVRELSDSIYKEYLSLLENKIEIINPKVIILFGNQVSSIVLNEKISVSQCRKKEFQKDINKKIQLLFCILPCWKQKI